MEGRGLNFDFLLPKLTIFRLFPSGGRQVEDKTQQRTSGPGFQIPEVLMSVKVI